MNVYILASSTQWPLLAFLRRRAKLPGRWLTVTTSEDLNNIAVSNPRYIFFPHWSHLIAPSILETVECVGFHMTDLPYGRGGSPLQNLIERGHDTTKITAFRMTEELDAGPIYCKAEMSLDGAAHEIYARAAEISLDLMAHIVANEPVPAPQEGTPTVFKRRHPRQSLLPSAATPEWLYDYIRMLDADGYPRAFLEWDDWLFEFRDAKLTGEELNAKVRISLRRSS